MSAPQCPLLGGKADIILGKADIKKCPLMTQTGHELGHHQNFPREISVEFPTTLRE
jgi:hypothetical protein